MANAQADIAFLAGQVVGAIEHFSILGPEGTPEQKQTYKEQVADRVDEIIAHFWAAADGGGLIANATQDDTLPAAAARVGLVKIHFKDQVPANNSQFASRCLPAITHLAQLFDDSIPDAPAV